MKLNAIIVDDEKFAREDLKFVLHDFPEIKIVGEASKIAEAESLCVELKPDLIFLDIKMRGEFGFELLAKIDKDIKIVFVTAFDDYAVRAFEVNALDYLLKPVNPERLRLMLEKVVTPDKVESSNLPFEINDSIFIQMNSEFGFLKIADIIVITSASDYSEVYLSAAKKFLTSKPMREWEERLPVKNFCRIHRSTIVNLEHVEKVEEWFNNSFSVKVVGIEKPFIMSRNYASKIKKLFS